MKTFIKDFKEFALKGNVLDMAIGVIIGGAFGKIVSSLVADIVTPLISLLTGKVMLTDLKWVIAPAIKDEAGNIIQAETALTYGNFIQSVIDFFIIALSIFIVLKIIINTQKKLAALAAKNQAEEEAQEEEAKETELDVLMEIRDLLQKDQ